MFHDYGSQNLTVAQPIVEEMCGVAEHAIGVPIRPPPVQGLYPSYKGEPHTARFYRYNAPVGVLSIFAEKRLSRGDLLAPIAHELGAAAIYQNNPREQEREIFWRAHHGICAHVELALLRAIGEKRLADRQERRLTRGFFARADAPYYLEVHRAVTAQGLAALVADPLKAV